MAYTSRLLEAWLLQQEQESADLVKREVSEARKRLEKERGEWVDAVASSIFDAADLDASFLRTSLARRNEKAAAYHGANPTRTATTSVVGPSYDAHSSEAGGGNDNAMGTGDRSAQKETAAGGWATSAWVEIRARTDEDGLRSTVRDQPKAEEDAAEMEATAAGKRCERLESLATLARQGLAAQWGNFFRDEMERRRLAAAALDMTADRWAQRQRELVGILRASWHGREWKSAAALGTNHAPPAEAGDAVEVVTTEDPVEGDKANVDGGRPDIGSDTAAKSEPGEAAADTGGALAARAVVVKDGGDFNIEGPSDAQALEEAAAADELLVLFGRGMAFHASTIRSSHMQHFLEEHRLSTPSQHGQWTKR